MNKASQETASTQTKPLAITDENISQAEYERLRAGEKIEVEVEKSASEDQESSGEIEVDESETSQTDGEEDESNDESEVEAKEGNKKPKRGFKKRIDKLNARLQEKEAEIEHWRREALRGQKIEEKPEAKTQEINALKSDEPNPDDFDTAADYYKAHAKWAVREEIKAKDAEAEKSRLLNERKSKVETHNKKVDDYRKENPDFDKHVSDFFEEYGTNFNVSAALEEVLTDSDLGPAVLHELVKNPDEFERINSLNAVGVARAIGRLEQKLSGENKKTEIKTKTTKAPPPPKPISASSANGKKSIHDDDISQAEYERLRNEQEKRRRAY